MKTIKLLFAAFAAPLTLQAATISLPAGTTNATSPDPAIAGNVVVNAGTLINAEVDITNTGNATTGSWSGSGRGGTSIDLVNILGNPVASVDLRTQTSMTSTAINFNAVSTTSGTLGLVLGAVNLQSVVGAGLIQTWGASVNLTQLGLNFDANTTYSLTFDLTQSTSLLGQLSPAVFNNFSATVGDQGGTYGQGVLPAGLLGITDIFGGSGTATLTFTTDAVIDGPVIARFGATALADTDLLGGLLGVPNSTLYSISGLEVNSVPEPSAAAMMALIAGFLGIFRKRR